MNLRIYTVFTLALLALAAETFGTDRNSFQLELMGGWIDVDPNPRSLWVTDLSVNQREPEEYISDSDSIQFNEIRFLAPLGRVGLLVGYERESRVSSDSSYVQPDIEILLQLGSARVEAFDAAVFVPIQLGRRWFLRPWGGPTSLQIEQERTLDGWITWDPMYVAHTTSNRREFSRLWGIGYGIEAQFGIGNRWNLTARALQRWAWGDTDFSGYDQQLVFERPYEPGDHTDSEFRQDYRGTSESTTAMMFGLEIGVRGRATRWISMEVGWRYRDWTDQRASGGGWTSPEGGPGIYNGPFLRAIASF